MPVESTFIVSQMDCPSEERLIRMALEPVEGVAQIRVDIPARRLFVVHAVDPSLLLERLEPLALGTSHEGTIEVDGPVDAGDSAGERTVLIQLLAINGVMFVVEMGVGVYAQSTGLIADGADMLADAMVYGLSLYAVGRALADQQRAAKVSGVLQLLLALGILADVGRRAWLGSEPAEGLMMGIAALALVANIACIALLAPRRDDGVHLQASWIFTTNDALANLGVILAGALVWATGSAAPDLVIGTLVAGLVLLGAARILRAASA